MAVNTGLRYCAACNASDRDWQVDGLANSVGADFDLSNGPIARSILNAAGDDIQQELNSLKPSSAVRAGVIVATRGHHLDVSYVFHGVLKHWDDGRGDAEAVSSAGNL